MLKDIRQWNNQYICVLLTAILTLATLVPTMLMYYIGEVANVLPFTNVNAKAVLSPQFFMRDRFFKSR